MSSRSGLFREHVFKVRVVQRACVQGESCLKVMSSRSVLFRRHVFKVRLVKRSCL